MAVHEVLKSLNNRHSIPDLKGDTQRFLLVGLAGVGLLGASAAIHAHSQNPNHVGPSPLAQPLPTDFPTSFSSSQFIVPTETNPPQQLPSSTPTITPSSTSPPKSTETATPINISTSPLTSPSQTPTVEPTTKKEEAVPNAEIGVLHSFTGEVEGVKFSFSLGLGKDIMERVDRPFSNVELNTAYWDTKYGPGTAANLMAKAIAHGHYLGYAEEHPGATYEDFMQKMRNEENVNYSILTSVAGKILDFQEAEVDPRKNTLIIYTNKYGGAIFRPKSGNPGDNNYFPGASVRMTQDVSGNLIMSPFFAAGLLTGTEPNTGVVSGSATTLLVDTLFTLGRPALLQTSSPPEHDIVEHYGSHAAENKLLKDILITRGERPLVLMTEPSS